jgi:small subunit ribosomal protein S6
MSSTGGKTAVRRRQTTVKIRIVILSEAKDLLFTTVYTLLSTVFPTFHTDSASRSAVRGRTPQKEVPMNRTYEIMFIVRPDLDEAEIEKAITTFTGYITDGGGKVTNSLAEQKMGRRRLAYTVKKFNDGFYILLVAEAPASLISEIERRLRVSEQVIKFITVRMDEENKRVAKIKAHRDAHVKRSALPQASPEAAAATPAPEAAAEPAAAAEPVAAEV